MGWDFSLILWAFCIFSPASLFNKTLKNEKKCVGYLKRWCYWQFIVLFQTAIDRNNSCQKGWCKFEYLNFKIRFDKYGIILHSSGGNSLIFKDEDLGQREVNPKRVWIPTSLSTCYETHHSWFMYMAPYMGLQLPGWLHLQLWGITQNHR